MPANFKQRLNQVGDTIVEVMVVVSILGLAFSMAYATATRSLNKTRNAEEHAEALQYINSQVELVRNAVSNPKLQTEGNPYCMDPATDKPVFSSPLTAAYTDTCTKLGLEGLFDVTINYIAKPSKGAVPDDVYWVRISWPGISNLGTQQESMYYKVHP